MYFVNRSEIEAILNHMDTLLNEVKEAGRFQTPIEKLGLERVIHVVIESIIDVGNLMIDGFIMRDPGGYHDIIDILVDEKVIPEDEEASYKAFINLRQMLVQQYLQVDINVMERELMEHYSVISQFSSHILTYIESELGVANTFANESQE